MYARAELLNQLSWVAIFLWAAGMAMNAALLLVLLWKRRYRKVPAFTVWISWAILTTVGLFLVRTYGDKNLYAPLYWTAAFVDLLFQLAVVTELAVLVFRRGGRWVERSRIRLITGGGCATLLAATLAATVTPAASSAKDALYSRISLFETILFTGLFLAAVATSQQLGVRWGDLVARVGTGFLVLNVVAFVTDTLHAYWRTANHFGDLEHLRMGVYLATLAYWTCAFSLPERIPEIPDERTKKKLSDYRIGLESSNIVHDRR